jgi:uncharacterized delta-60 repeat protein
VTQVIERLESRRLLSAGDLDLTFGSSGTVLGSNIQSTPVTEEALTPDGGIVITRANDHSVRKLTSTGAVATSFGTNGVFTISFWTTDAIAVQPDGKILVAGTQSGTNADAYIIRLTATGQLDSTWDGDGVLTVHFPTIGTSLISAIAVQPDGKVVIGGRKNSLVFVGRMNSNGSLDTTFDTDGYASASYTGKTVAVSAMVVRSDGQIDVGGRTVPTGSSTGNVMITQFQSNGAADTTFDSDGRVELPQSDPFNLIATLIERPNGKLLAAGQLSNASGPTILQFNATGSLDTTFGGGDGIVQLNVGGGLGYSAYGIALEPGGRVIVSAARDTDPTSTINNAPALFALNVNGSSDTTFGVSGVATTSFGTGLDAAGRLLIQPDGKLLQSGGKAYLGDPFGIDYYTALIRYQGYTGSIAGNLFNDLDHDGVHDGGEPNLANRNVYLDLDGDSTLDSNEPVARTDSSGNYLFPSLDPATYVVREVLPDAQWAQTSPPGTAGRTVNVASAAVTGINFGSADFVPPSQAMGRFILKRRT